MINNEEKIRIELLGQFTMSYKGKIYINDVGSNKKILSLLQYLIINRNNRISYDNIIYAMKLDEGNKNPSAVLKNLIYRVRSLLKASGLPEYEYIIFKSGAYRWNNDIPCEIDVALLEYYCKMAESKDIPLENRIIYYKKAIDIYGGNLLPKSSEELWVIPLSSYYNSLFDKSINEYFKLIYKTDDISLMINICEKAIIIDPFSESYYMMLIYCYYKLEKYSDALEAYKKITDLLYDDLGVKPSNKLLDLYKTITSKMNQIEYNIVKIDEDIRDVESFENGTFYCTFAMFKSIVQYTIRMTERVEIPVSLVLFTITDLDGNMPIKKARITTMDNLKDTISSTLRKGDAFTKYSPTQYLIMLVNADYENAGRASQRIVDMYSKKYSNRKIKILYKVKKIESYDNN